MTSAEEGHGGDGVGSSVREDGEEDIVQARWEDLSQIVGRVKVLDKRLGEFCRRADRVEELPDADLLERRQSKVHLQRSQHSSPPSTRLRCSGRVLRFCLGRRVQRGCRGARGWGQPRIRVQVQDREVVEVQDLGGEELELVAREVEGMQRGEPPDPLRERVEAVLPQGQDVQVREGPERIRDGVDGDVIVAEVELDGYGGRRRGWRKGRRRAEGSGRGAAGRLAQVERGGGAGLDAGEGGATSFKGAQVGEVCDERRDIDQPVPAVEKASAVVPIFTANAKKPYLSCMQPFAFMTALSTAVVQLLGTQASAGCSVLLLGALAKSSSAASSGNARAPPSRCHDSKSASSSSSSLSLLSPVIWAAGARPSAGGWMTCAEAAVVLSNQLLLLTKSELVKSPLVDADLELVRSDLPFSSSGCLCGSAGWPRWNWPTGKVVAALRFSWRASRLKSGTAQPLLRPESGCSSVSAMRRRSVCK